MLEGALGSIDGRRQPCRRVGGARSPVAGEPLARRRRFPGADPRRARRRGRARSGGRPRARSGCRTATARSSPVRCRPRPAHVWPSWRARARARRRARGSSCALASTVSPSAFPSRSTPPTERGVLMIVRDGPPFDAEATQIAVLAADLAGLATRLCDGRAGAAGESAAPLDLAGDALAAAVDDERASRTCRASRRRRVRGRERPRLAPARRRPRARRHARPDRARRNGWSAPPGRSSTSRGRSQFTATAGPGRRSPCSWAGRLSARCSSASVRAGRWIRPASTAWRASRSGLRTRCGRPGSPTRPGASWSAAAPCSP